MRLGKRILDLLKAVVRSAPRDVMAAPQPAGSHGGDDQPEQLRRALARAEDRRQKLEQNLATAGQAGREREAMVMRRQIDELARSSEGLSQALEVIEARREAAVRSPAAPATSAPDNRGSLADGEAVAGETAPAADTDLEARKRRLAGPG
jgi:seryl-tRNA synthetase